MLIGKLPFDAPTPAAFLEKLRSENPTPIRSLRRDTPWTLALLVKRCMAMSAHRRPLSAAAASNLISPLRSRVRRRWIAAAAAVASVTAAASLIQTAPTWEAYGLPDAVAEADLGAAVRSYDVGDRLSALRHLERLAVQAPKSAALAFWRATVHHDMGDEPGRRKACADTEFVGANTWLQLGHAACGTTYELAPPILGVLSEAPGAAGPEFLPLAVTESLVPRVESARSRPHPALDEASHVSDRLESEPKWSPPWALPVRWQAARVHLAVARGDLASAQERLESLRRDHGSTPLTKELDSWLNLHLGNVEASQDLALELLPENPGPNVRLMMEAGELERAWQHISALEGDPRHARLRQAWCGYAHRFELPLVPQRCSDLPPGFVRMLWAQSAAGARDRLTMTPHEQTVLRRQQDLNLGNCALAFEAGPTLTHAAAPFELYGAQQEITAALCDADRQRADLKYARGLAQTVIGISPQDPWSLLLQAAVDEAMGQQAMARAKRLAVAARWRAADGDLPLVARLRRRVGAITMTPPPPAAPRPTNPGPATAPAGANAPHRKTPGKTPIVAQVPEDE